MSLNVVLPLTAVQALPHDVSLVMFDMAGTTVNDTVNGMPLVTAAMIRAFAAYHITITEQSMTPHRGKAKRDAVKALIEAHRDQIPTLHKLHTQSSSSSSSYSSALAVRVDHIFHLFNQHLDTLLASVSSEIEGTTHVMRTLKSRGIKIGVGSGFSHAVVHRIVENMGWAKHGLIDYIGSADSVPKGRPDPGMILQCMKHCGVTDPRQVVKVGDTQVDVEEGRNAGTWTVAVLTGTQSRDTLASSRPHFILSSVALLPAILTTPLSSQVSMHVTRGAGAGAARIRAGRNTGSLTRQGTATGASTRHPHPHPTSTAASTSTSTSTALDDIDTDMFPRLTTRRYHPQPPGNLPSRL